MDGLAVLMTNMVLSGRTGTEILTRNIALELARRGHRPVVYSPHPGEMADELLHRSIPVVAHAKDLNRHAIDVIHGHHLPSTLTAAMLLPRTPIVFFCHDFVAWHDAPPVLPAVRRYVAVDRTVLDRLTLRHGIPADQAMVLLNPVDLERYPLGPALPPTPRRALAFAKNHEHVEAIREVCARRAMEVDFIGTAVGNVAHPEDLLPRYDVVFASAMSAMEAMATGRAVMICDGRGLAGFCTPARFREWRAYNFGLRTLRKRVLVADLSAELDRYDPAEAAEVCRLLRAEGGMQAYGGKIVSLYREAIGRPLSGADDLRTLEAAGSILHDILANDHAPSWKRERDTLLDDMEALSHGVEKLPAGTEIEFSAGGNREYWRPVCGLSRPESWGVWTSGELARFFIRPDREGPLRACFTFNAFLPDRGSRALRVWLSANGSRLSDWNVDTAETQTRDVAVPASLFDGAGGLTFEFRIDAPRSPKSLGLFVDERRLGLGLIRLRLCQSG